MEETYVGRRPRGRKHGQRCPQRSYKTKNSKQQKTIGFLQVLQDKLPWIILLTSFTYFALLSTKTFTWIYTSADAADWLAASKLWMVPQPTGAPLVVLLGHLLNAFPGDLVVKLTIFLSCLPSAGAVALTYLIAKKITTKWALGLLASGIVVGCNVFLAEATVTKLEYSLAGLIIAGATYLWVTNHKNWAFAVFGLGAAIHATVAASGLLILIILALRKAKLEQLKWLGLFLLTGLTPYIYILVLMYLPTPRFIAGGLNLYHMKVYFLGVTSNIVGTIAIDDFGTRLLAFSKFLIVGFGLALVPIAWYLVNRLKHTRIKVEIPGLVFILAPVLFIIWYYVTCLDPGTWPYLAMIVPGVATLAVKALSYLSTNHMRIVAIGCLALIIANGFMFNANTLAKADPLATDVLREINSLPDGSVIVTTQGSTSFTTFYAISQGKKIVPLVWSVIENGFSDYADYLENTYGVNTTADGNPELLKSLPVIKGETVKGYVLPDGVQLLVGSKIPRSGAIEGIKNCLSSHRDVYFLSVRKDAAMEVTRCLELQKMPGYKYTEKITGLTYFFPLLYH